MDILSNLKEHHFPLPNYDSLCNDGAKALSRHYDGIKEAKSSFK